VSGVFLDVFLCHHTPISVYGQGEMPIQCRGQSVSATRGKVGVRLNAHTEMRANISAQRDKQYTEIGVLAQVELKSGRV
jgi:hypothetical protein